MKSIASSFLVFLFLVSQNVAACTSCLCGDPTLTTLGTEKPYAGRIQLGYEVLQREETTGEGTNKKEVVEVRHTLTASYWPVKYLGLSLAAPVHSTLDMTLKNGAEQRGSGLGDLDLNARYYQWQNRKMNAGWIGGVRLPIGEEQKTVDGQAINIDAQPAQGVIMGRLGAWYSRYRYPWSYHGSIIVNIATDTGFQGFKPGKQLTFSGLGQFAFSQTLSLSFGIEGRYGDKDTFFTIEDDDSGGGIAYGAINIIGKWLDSGLWNIKVQYEVLDELNGSREEPYVLYMGLGYGF